MKNWKTTVAGVAVALIALLTYTHILTAEQATAIMGALTSLGLVAAKDSNVTGGTTQQ